MFDSTATAAEWMERARTEEPLERKRPPNKATEEYKNDDTVIVQTTVDWWRDERVLIGSVWLAMAPSAAFQDEEDKDGGEDEDKEEPKVLMWHALPTLSA